MKLVFRIAWQLVCPKTVALWNITPNIVRTTMGARFA